MRRIILMVTAFVAVLCGGATVQAAQVTVRPPSCNVFREECGGRVMVVPVLTHHGPVPEYHLHHGWEQLYETARRICREAGEQAEGEFGEHPEEKVTGFVPQFARFNEIRHELIPLMQRYNLGFPPTLEDFNEISSFVVKRPPRHSPHPSRSSGPYLEEVKGVPCRFDVTI